MKKYDSYKDSGTVWIGEIPNCWKIKRFSYSFDIKKGKLPKILIDEPTNSALPYLSMEVLRGGHPKEFIVDNDGVKVGEGDIGLLWDGSNSGEVIKIMRKGILSSTVSLISIKDPGINKEFSFYFLKFLEVDFKNNTIGMGIPHVDGNHIRESKIILPSLAEQQQIVTFLDSKTSHIDELIQKKQGKIELLTEYRTSLINEVVTRGLNPNAKMKDSGAEWIGEIPSKWNSSCVRYVTLEHRQGYYSSDSYTDNGLRVVRITDLNDDRTISIENSPFYQLSELEKDRFILKCGDFLFPRTGGVGRFGIFNDSTPSIYGSFLIRFRFSEKVVNQYMRYYFDSGIYLNQILSEIHGGVNQNVHVENIKDCKIFYPNILEQNEIVSYLDEQTEKIDSSIQLEKKKIKLLKEYRQSLISEVVTGKIKVF